MKTQKFLFSLIVTLCFVTNLAAQYDDVYYEPDYVQDRQSSYEGREEGDVRIYHYDPVRVLRYEPFVLGAINTYDTYYWPYYGWNSRRAVWLANLWTPKLYFSSQYVPYHSWYGPNIYWGFNGAYTPGYWGSGITRGQYYPGWSFYRPGSITRGQHYTGWYTHDHLWTGHTTRNHVGVTTHGGGGYHGVTRNNDPYTWDGGHDQTVYTPRRNGRIVNGSTDQTVHRPRGSGFSGGGDYKNTSETPRVRGNNQLTRSTPRNGSGVVNRTIDQSSAIKGFDVSSSVSRSGLNRSSADRTNSGISQNNPTRTAQRAQTERLNDIQRTAPQRARTEDSRGINGNVRSGNTNRTSPTRSISRSTTRSSPSVIRRVQPNTLSGQGSITRGRTSNTAPRTYNGSRGYQRRAATPSVNRTYQGPSSTRTRSRNIAPTTRSTQGRVQGPTRVRSQNRPSININRGRTMKTAPRKIQSPTRTRSGAVRGRSGGG